MKTILVNIDNLSKSKEYIAYSARVARDLCMAVRLLYVFDPNNYPLGIPGSVGDDALWINENILRETDETKRQFDKMIRNLKDEIPDMPMIDYDVETGFITDIIEDISRENYIKMIMLQENESRKDKMIGDADIDIIRHTECPVWIIPENAVYHPYKSVVYATDYNENDIRTLKKLIRLIKPYSPAITALHITESLDFDERIKSTGFKDILTKKVSYKNVDVKAITEKSGKNIVESIDDYVNGNHADLIVLLKEDRHFLDRIFKVSSAKKLIRHSQQPVLVFHEKHHKSMNLKN